MKVWLFPIEALPERYSEQWSRWWPAELRRLGVDVVVVNAPHSTSIKQGQFLDVVDTNRFKALQLEAFAGFLERGGVEDDDVVLLLDAWNPQLLSLAYMRDLGRVRFRIAGLFHAGSYDPWDLLGQNQRVAEWAQHAEQAYVRALDRVFVATHFHAKLLCNRRVPSWEWSKVEVTGFPLYAAEWEAHAQPWEKRQRVVVFPHRLAPEKDPQEFDVIRAAYELRYGLDGTQWIKTKEACETKEEYYALLGRARVAVSTARQETWGIAMLEAASLGCHPVVPDRLSYSEIYDPTYVTAGEAARLVRQGLDAPRPHDFERAPWELAISRMMASLEAGR
jgi:glycosyltransferase involved in cell wall biosynthesis